MKLLSTEAEGVNEALPEERRPQFVNDAGRVGALLGLRSNERPVSMSSGNRTASESSLATVHGSQHCPMVFRLST